jgi:hypothetical protein
VPSKVLLVVIDAATPHVVCPAIRTGRLPVFQRLMEAGTMHERSVSIFPSITPAATSSIITGAYPAEHGIAGASWYDEAAQEVAYYGDDFWVIAREGFGEFVRDFLLRLNGDRLTAPTLFQLTERAGRTAACLNYLVFRGNHAHDVRIPSLMAALPGVPLSATVEGPSMLCLGDFVGTRSPAGKRVDEKGGLLHRFGMDDASTGVMLRDLAATREWPDFTVAYFADNDYRSHIVGPVAALPVVERVDAMLGDAFDAAGGLETVLEEMLVIVTSDHGHCDILADPGAVIRLDLVLEEFRPAALGKPWGARDGIMICPNMRTAQIYVREPSAERMATIVGTILREKNVDQVFWRTRLTRDGAHGYTAMSSRGRIEFARTTDGGVVDEFGGRWTWHGDPAVLDLEITERAVTTDQYPNAFERIAGALDLDKSGEIWVTAKPGCEFEVPGGKAHLAGASHGALHALDSLSPLIVAGPERVRLPQHVRSIDIAPLIMERLGIPMRYKVGDHR